MHHSVFGTLIVALGATVILPSCASPTRQQSPLVSAAGNSPRQTAVSIDSGSEGWKRSQHAVRKTASPRTPFIADRNDPILTIQNSDDVHTSAESSLSLEHLEQLANANNPSLQQAIWLIEQARGVRNQVGLYPNPILGLQGSEVGNNGRAGQWGPYIQQTIVLGNKLCLNQAVADQDVQALIWQSQAQQLRVLNDVRMRYYEALGAQKKLEVAAELEGIAVQGVSVAKDLFAAKQGSKPDILQAEIQLSEIRIRRRNAQSDFDTAWRRLTAVLGQPSMPAVRIDGELTHPATQREFEPTFATLIAGSPEIQSGLAQVRKAQALLRRQQAQPVPNLLAQVGVAHDYGTGDAIANFQIGVPLPVFNRNQGNISSAHAEYHQARQNIERLKLTLKVRLTIAFRQYLQAYNEIQLVEQDILPRAAENRSLTEQAYELGEFDFLRVLTARRTYFESNLRYVEALTQLRKADTLIEGLLLTGGLDAPAEPGDNSGLRGQTLNGQ